MNSLPNFNLFRPKKSQNRSKIDRFRKFFNFLEVFSLEKLDIYDASANGEKSLYGQI